MDQEQGFIDAILTEPGEDIHRLVYADWLEDRNDPRGEFLRAVLELVLQQQFELQFFVPFLPGFLI
jgi:uncharacterized protein (TIGR02996 family)